ncbi:ubiquinone-dependent pyruvate dehydrogenase [Arcobacter sp. CECT 8985]|uniref:ubiquinone-dependent pyruvate dehydrogenase n=1 Tax=Arcobacter sp. CECT 8985 TaxID=1935424 RepID=UPI00100B627A|nr:ubiquinone-dependent pyruvate dehydrogenase [Arcobacter sp. CECT 8985]RXJ86052.1 ubiquinone-dependent pyruvate dehydrogenase [Arcobacter sp. CECT 8985]
MNDNIAMYFAKLLKKVGIKRIWGITGDSLNGLSDSLKKLGDIEWIGTRHEETAAFAAGADAKVSGKIAVCAGSSGPGNLHLINGLFDCQRKGVPVLAIASHIPSTEIGSGYFQETHPQELFKECSVFCELVTNPEQMPHILETAIRQAILKKGVSVIVIPGDTMLSPMPESSKLIWNEPHLPKVLPDEGDIIELAKILNENEKVTFMCGAGCIDSHDEIVKLAHLLNAPVVHALGGKEYIEGNNPNSVGMTGLIGYESGYYAMENSDVVLVLGSGFPYKAFYPENAKIVQIDIKPEALGRHTQIDLGMVGDIKSSLEMLIPRINKKDNNSFLKSALKHYRNTVENFDKLASGNSKSGLIHPQYLTKLIDKHASEDAIFTCDVGTPTVWAARYINMNGKRKLIGSFNHGSMASALPQAIGAKVSSPNKEVIALCGDGGFAMLMGDFLTLIQHKIKAKIVIYDNSSLGFVAIEMKAGGYLYDNTELENPDFSAIAKAVGVKSFRVEEPEELENTIKEFLQYDGAALLDVTTAKQELTMPPKIDFENAKGFGIYMIRAIINGKGDELIEVAKENILR